MLLSTKKRIAKFNRKQKSNAAVPGSFPRGVKGGQTTNAEITDKMREREEREYERT